MTTSGSLFREEAVRGQQQQWLGGLRLVTPLRAQLLIAVACAIAVAIIAFALLGSYTRRVTASGSLVPATGLLTLTAAMSGRIQRMMVREDQSVRAGQLLVVIANERSSLAGETGQVVLTQMRTQRARLDDEIAQAQRLGQAQTDSLQQRSALLQAQIAALRQRRVLAQQQAQQSDELLRRIAPLGAKGFVSAFEIARQRSQALDAQTQVKTADQQLLELRVQLAAARDQRQQLPITLASQRSVLERQRDGLDQAIAQAEAERASVLRAPRDGRITSVLAVVGQPVAAGQAMLALAPAGAPLEADLLLPSAAVGFVQPGQRVALRLAAFPYQKFGLLAATVTRVGQSALTPGETALLLGGQAPQTPLYRVRARLDAQTVLAYGKPAALLPGMTLDADLLLERRSLLEWVFEPLYGFTRALPGNAQTRHGGAQ